MKLIKNLLTENNCYKAGETIIPKGIMPHSSGANNPTLKRYVQPNIEGIGVNKYSNDWNRPKPDGKNKCPHAFLGKLENGDIATVQTLPWNYRGWHCGSGKNGSANDTHISFEICEDGLTDKTYFDKVYKEAVELCAYLCKLYKLDPLKDGVIIDHSEGYKRGIASNHGDVNHWFPKHGKSMDTFRADVNAELNKVKPNVQTGGDTTFKIRVSKECVAYKEAASVPKGVYTITETKGNMGKLKSGVGWVNLTDVVKM